MKKGYYNDLFRQNVDMQEKGDAYVLLKNIGYDFIARNKHNCFLSQLYHGKNGVITDTVIAKQVEEFLKKYGNKPRNELLGAKIYTVPMDGRKRGQRGCHSIRLICCFDKKFLW